MPRIRRQARATTVGKLTLQISRTVGLVAFGLAVAGCYTMQPAAGVSPELGSTLAFSINDVGRVALGGSMGPEIDQIEGRLISNEKEGNGSDYLVAVSAVRLLRGGNQVWRGEQVHIKSDYVNTIYFKRYSAGRTVLVSAIAVAGVAALAGAAIIGSGMTTDDPSDTNPGTLRRTPRWPRSFPPRILHHTFPPLRTP